MNIQDQTKKINKPLSSVEKQSKKTTKEMSESWKNMAGLIGTSAVLLSMKTLIQSTIKYGDELDKLSLRLGVTVEELDKLKQIADLSGVEFNTLTKSMQQLVYGVGQVASGIRSVTGPVASTLKELKLDVQELTVLNPDKQFLKIAEAISKLGSASKKIDLVKTYWVGT